MSTWKSGWGAATPSPAQLTSYIKNARTIHALFQTCSTYESHLNHIHLSACWSSLGHLVRAAGPYWFQENADAVKSLVQRTIQIASSAEIRARQLANIAYGVARSGRGHAMEVLMKALARSIEWRLGECNSQELANTAWAFAKAGHLDATFFAALARCADQRLDEFNPQELTNTAWAFATVGHSDAQLFKALARVVESRLGDFSTQGLANTAWAFAKAGHLDAKLFTAMANSAVRRVDEFNAQDLANTAWAFAKAGHFDAQLFESLARSAEWHVESFNAQGLANTVWAFAKAGHVDAQLFTALSKSIDRRLSDFNPQDLANTAWAFAKGCHLDAQFFTALARSAESRVDDLNAQDLVNTAWAFAKIGHLDAQFFIALARSIERRLKDFSAQHIASIAWAFAKAGQLDAQLFTALARSAEKRLRDFSAQDLANMAWAFANAGQLDAQLFAAMATSVDTCLDDLNDEELDNAAWAFLKAGQQGIVKRIRQRKKRNEVVSLAPVDVSRCGRIVVAGGGIGGAAVAVALQNKGFDVIVLESDTSFDARKQGYGLTIQGYDLTTQKLGISLAQDDAPSTSHYTFSADGHILGFYGEEFSQNRERREPSTNAGRFVHLPRQMLRARLLEQIRPEIIRWNSRLDSFSDRKDGVTVTLTDGTTIDAALLIGSDGIFSTVRRQLALPGDRLNYLGLVVVLGIVPTASPSSNNCNGKRNGKKKEDEVVASSLLQRRIFETVDGATRIYAMPFTEDSTMWQLSFPFSEEAAKKLVKKPAALKEEIMRRCAEWHEPIPVLLGKTPLDCMSGYPVYDRELLDPDVLRKPSTQPTPQRRVTLIGDAAHPMSPFKAQGANQALADAVLLADSLEDGIRRHGPHIGLDMALPLFEQKMLSRSARMVVGSREKAKELHSSLALQPARKVQRETGVDMEQGIRALRAKGIGAHSATDPRGLDVVVAEAIQVPGLVEDSAQLRSGPKEVSMVRKQKENGTSRAAVALDTYLETQNRLWGYFDDEWHKCVLVKSRKSGKHKVEWTDGTTSVLDADCVQPRLKKARSGREPT